MSVSGVCAGKDRGRYDTDLAAPVIDDADEDDDEWDVPVICGIHVVEVELARPLE